MTSDIVFDDWPAEFCACALGRHAGVMKANVCALSEDLQYPLDSGGSECKQYKMRCGDLLNQAMLLRRTVRAAKFDIPIASEGIALLISAESSLDKVPDLITGADGDRKKAITLLGRCQSKLEELKALADEAIACGERLDLRASRPDTVLRVKSPKDPALAATDTTFRFLHLTDLHLGQPHNALAFQNTFERLATDLDAIESSVEAPWDAVFFTGDATFSGAPEQFDEFDEFIGRLWERWKEERGWSPKLLAVPGNHDLAWQKESDARVDALLNRYHTSQHGVAKDLWEKGTDSQYYPCVAGAFENYSDWWDRLSPTLKPDGVTQGLLPGDFSATLAKNGRKLGIVGLNSAFLQLTKGKGKSKDYFKGRLAVSCEQFRLACGGQAPDWANDQDLCLLMTHHPSDWFRACCQKSFEEDVFLPKRFRMLLCGHTHEPRIDWRSKQLGSPRRESYGRSLFGMEKCASGKIDRIHGYAGYQISVGDDLALLRLWPRVASPDLDHKLVADTMMFPMDVDAAESCTPFVDLYADPTAS